MKAKFAGAQSPNTNGGWNDFFFALLFNLGAPLLPLILEVGPGADFQCVSDQTLFLTGALFCLSIGLFSRSMAVFGAGFLSYAGLMSTFGHVNAGLDPWGASGTIAWVLIGIAVLTHLVERYVRHVLNERPHSVRTALHIS